MPKRKAAPRPRTSLPVQQVAGAALDWTINTHQVELAVLKAIALGSYQGAISAEELVGQFTAHAALYYAAKPAALSNLERFLVFLGETYHVPALLGINLAAEIAARRQEFDPR
jgi:hypothetical protein